MSDSMFISAAQSPSPEPNKESESIALLREILDVQRQQLEQAQAHAAAHDPTVRWRNVLERWQSDFPTLTADCQNALPILERAYGTLLAGMVEELTHEGEDALDNDFALQEFLDRYGMRLGQLGNILSLVGPLAEAASQKEKSNQ